MASIAVIDPESGGPVAIQTGAFDGRDVWLACMTQTGQQRLLRLPGWDLAPDAADASSAIDPENPIINLTFDGARMWIQQPSQVLVRDVSIDSGIMDTVITPNDPGWPGTPAFYYQGLCDGRRVWLAGTIEGAGFGVSSFGARFAALQGRVPILSDSQFTAMTFDGTHMWFAGHSKSGPQLLRYLAAGE